MDKYDCHGDFYTKKMQVHLSARDPISPDSYLFRFKFQNAEERLDMLVTQHILIYGQNLKNEIVSRKYTAIVDEKGYFSIPIKIYRPNSHPNFPEGGELTPWLEKIELNTQLTIKRCIGKLLYNNGQFTLKPKNNKVIQKFHTILMVCGGSGITPAYQLIQAVCKNAEDQTKIFLLYANRTYQDIWLKNELDTFAKNSNNFKVHYTLDKPSEGWNGFNGFVTLEMMKSIFPQIDQGVLAVLCGPKPMNKMVIQLYQDLGLPKDQILKF